MKNYRLHFRHRETGTLKDVFETHSAKSKAAAVRGGKAIAESRGWWFIAALMDQPELRKAKP